MQDTEQNTEQGTQQNAQRKNASSRRADRVENYRLLHRAMTLSAGNHLAVVALAGVIMARAQGTIERGKHARRQTMLAMGQALHSAGQPLTPVSLAAVFLEMQHAGIFNITRDPSDSSTKNIIDVEVVHEQRGIRHTRDIGNHFEMTWSPTNVECFHTLAMAYTPRAPAVPCDAQTQPAQEGVAEAPALAETPKETDQDAEDPGPVGALGSFEPIRTFWVDEGFVDGPLH